MPNMPATVSAWIRLAPATLRDRKIASGTSGFRAVASRATNAARSASEAAPRPIAAPEPQPCSAAGLTIV